MIVDSADNRSSGPWGAVDGEWSKWPFLPAVANHRVFAIEPSRLLIPGPRLGEMAERMALNAPIQGSAADIIKVAMLGVDDGLREAGLRSRLLLQVHDELVLEIAPGEREAVERLVRAQMGGAYRLAVELDVSVGVGRTWDDAGH